MNATNDMHELAIDELENVNGGATLASAAFCVGFAIGFTAVSKYESQGSLVEGVKKGFDNAMH